MRTRKDGRSFWFGLHLMPVSDASPPLLRRAWPRHHRKACKSRQQQAAIQGLLAKVFMCVKAPVAIVSETGIVQMTNPALEEMLGYPPGGLVGKSPWIASHRLRPALLAAREKQMKDGWTIPASAAGARRWQQVPVEISSVMVQRDDLRRVPDHHGDSPAGRGR